MPVYSTIRSARAGDDVEARKLLSPQVEGTCHSKSVYPTSPDDKIPAKSPSQSEKQAERIDERPEQISKASSEEEPHHSPAGYMTPPSEKQPHSQPLQQQKRRLVENTFSVPYERLDVKDAADPSARLKKKRPPQQQQQQLQRPQASDDDVVHSQAAPQIAQPSQTATESSQAAARRAQSIVPALPRPEMEEKVGGTSKQQQQEAAASHAAAHNAPAPASHSSFTLWDAVDGAATALQRMRFAVPHPPIVVTPTTAPLGYSLEEVDGHHELDEPSYHNPPDAGAVAESRAERGTTAAADDDKPGILGQVVASLSHFGVLGIHHPIWP